jgi:hypothetical protein
MITYLASRAFCCSKQAASMSFPHGYLRFVPTQEHQCCCETTWNLLQNRPRNRRMARYQNGKQASQVSLEERAEHERGEALLTISTARLPCSCLNLLRVASQVKKRATLVTSPLPLQGPQKVCTIGIRFVMPRYATPNVHRDELKLRKDH